MTTNYAPAMFETVAAKLQYDANGTPVDVPGIAPSGGATGDVLTKNSGTNYDYSWAAPSGGGGSTAASALTGTTMASNVVNSSLVGVGTITTGVWNGTTIAVANGGTGDTGTAWTSYTPTITSQTGTFTSTTPTGLYKTIGKTTFVKIKVVINTVGTASGALYATLPNTAQGEGYVLAGRENALTGNMIQAFTRTSSTQLEVLYYNNTSPIAAGGSILISGSYQST